MYHVLSIVDFVGDVSRLQLKRMVATLENSAGEHERVGPELSNQRRFCLFKLKILIQVPFIHL